MLHLVLFFFLNNTPTTEIYTLSLHDALPILDARRLRSAGGGDCRPRSRGHDGTEARASRDRPHARARDRKSTRLNSSHTVISYAVFCLKKKKRDGQNDYDDVLHHAELFEDTR